MVNLIYQRRTNENKMEAPNSARSELSEIARNAFLSALKSVAPEQLIKAAVSLDETKTKLRFATQVGGALTEFDLSRTPSILVLGAGKATQELVSGLMHVLSECSVPNMKLKVQANYPKGQSRHSLPSLSGASVSILEASHPISDESTVSATNAQVEAIYNCEPGTLAIVLMSGGGSALYETTASFGSAPPSKISLNDLQIANKVLLESGANITEINTIRKHFSQVKGGRTAQHAIQSGKISAVVGLYLSDVVGNDLSSVASGPTCPDTTTFADCHAIISKYNIREKLPSAIVHHLDAAEEETPKPTDSLFEGKVFNFLIGSADTSAQASVSYLQPLGFKSTIFSNSLDGEASEYGRKLISMLTEKALLLSKEVSDDPHPNQTTKRRAAYVATGEFTVTIKGRGVGGRNQEMLLALLDELSKGTNTSAIPQNMEFAVLSCAFDGIEGNSPATGALIDSTSVSRLRNSSLLKSASDDALAQLLSEKLQNNDSYSVFGALEDAIITGYTGTNVNDLTMILLQSK